MFPELKIVHFDRAVIHQLTSLQHPLLEPFRELNRKKKNRRDDLFIGEGRLVVDRMLESDYELVSIVLGDQAADHFLDRIPDSVNTILLERSLVSQLVGFEFHSGVVASAMRRRHTALDSFESVIKNDVATLVVCPFTVLPENLGSIMRLSAGFGVNAVVVGSRSADPFGRRAMRVSMGNVLQLPVIEPVSIRQIVIELRERFGYHIVAATGGRHACELPMPRPAERLAIVLGNEAEGIERSLLKECDQEVSIRMAGGTDSLNVANALAVLLYQFTQVAM